MIELRIVVESSETKIWIESKDRKSTSYRWKTTDQFGEKRKIERRETKNKNNQLQFDKMQKTKRFKYIRRKQC